MVVNGIGGLYYEWEHFHPSERNMYVTCMGYVTPVALGLALGLPRRLVISMEGDGSLLMGMGALATIGWRKPKNLAVTVFDNECHEATGGLPTATSESADLAAVGMACGIRSSVSSSLAEFKDAVRYALSHPGPHLMVVKVETGTLKVPAVSVDGLEAKYRFVRQVETSEGRSILPAPRLPPKLRRIVEDEAPGKKKTR